MEYSSSGNWYGGKSRSCFPHLAHCLAMQAATPTLPRTPALKDHLRKCSHHCPVEAQVSAHSISPEFALLFQLLPAGVGRVSVSVWSILLSSTPLLFYQYNALGDECTLKMEKEDMPIKPSNKSLTDNTGACGCSGLWHVSAWMT